MRDVTDPDGSASEIRTGRVVIRPWRVDEVDRFFDIHRRIEVVRWWGGTPMQDRREARTLIERYLAQLAEDSRFGAWAVVVRSSGVPAGTVLLKPLPDGDGEIEIGWHLHPDSWGGASLARRQAFSWLVVSLMGLKRCGR
jgi:RimJ/RimL family protein N-acetyltransferase